MSDTDPRPDAIDRRRRNLNRALLVTIFVMFFGSMLVAGILRFSGWQPEANRNHGELLDPPRDLREVVPALADGGEYRWEEERTWRIVAAPPADCGAACDALAHDLDTVWRLFGKDADRVHLLWICGSEGCLPPEDARPRSLRLLQPDPRLAAALPGVEAASAAGVPVYVIDPNGFVILRYPAGFDPAGLRADVAKLLKLI